MNNLKKIHKDLRLHGIFSRIIMNFKNKKSFINMQKMTNKMFVGKKNKKLNSNEIYIKTPTNNNLRICIYKSNGIMENAVGLLWLHAGGYAIGAPEQEIGFIKQFVSAANCVVIAPAYTRSLDAPYPAALQDCYAALLWMKDNAKSIGIRDDQLFVGGDSAGGGLTAAITIFARDKGEVNIAFQMPLYPMIDDRMITKSSQNNNSPVWTSQANEIAWKMYLGDLYGSSLVPSYAAPARSNDYSGLPPTYTYVGSIEPFYDETMNYVNALQKANVAVEFDVYEGCFHGFDIIGARTPIGRKAKEILISKFKYAVEHYFNKQSSANTIIPPA
jgi:acetyl esterase/lipase